MAGVFQTRADNLVVPNAYATISGPGAGTTAPFSPNWHWLQVYDAQEFNSAAGDVLRINEIRFRIDEMSTVSSFSTVAKGLSIFMSTTTKTVATASPLFAFNPENPLFEALPSTDLPMNGSRTSATSFDVVIPIPNRYEYDRRVGNLLVDIRSVGGGGVPFLDLQGSDSTFVVSGPLDSDVGTKSGIGLVTRFEYQVVPEPSSVILFLSGGASLLTLAAKRRKKFHTNCEAQRRD
jgi:hypothetical protein